MAEIMDSMYTKMGKWASVIIVVAVIIGLLIINPFVAVDRGESVVIFNKYTGDIESLPPGTHVVWPFVYSTFTYETITQKYTRKSTASTSDLQTITIQVALNYSLDTKLLGKLHKEVGPGYETSIILPMMEESVKAATAKFAIDDIITQRPKLKRIIEDNIFANTKKLIASKLIVQGEKIKVNLPVLDDQNKPTGKSKKVDLDPTNARHIKHVQIPNYFVIENVNIEDVQFSAEYAKEVERKEIQKQKNETEKLAVVQARQSRLRQKEIDDAKAYSQKVLSQTATPTSVRLRWIEKWNGKLPETIAGGNASLLLGNVK